MDRLEISTNRKKSIKLIFLSLLFLVIGVWFTAVPESIHLGIFAARIIGISVIILAIITTFLSIKQTIKPKLVLIVDSKGLIINPKKMDNYHIPWSDINGFSEHHLHSQKFLTLDVKDPQKWLTKEMNSLKRKTMSLQMERFGSPFSLYSSSWDIGYDILKETLNDYLVKSNAS